MLNRWRVPPHNLSLAQALAQAVGVHPFTAQVLLNRGLGDPALAERFLSPESHAFSDPYLLPDMDAAVERLREAIRQKEMIVVFGDSDVDGLTASIIVEEALEAAGGIVRVRQANRISDGYGLPESAVDAVIASQARVLVLVDCGTNQAAAVDRLAQAGIDTVILDHHVPLDGGARAKALVNPFQTVDAVGRELCSAGLAFKLAQALLPEAAWKELDAYLDLAALGTLADCAPLRAESRQIVSRGLSHIVNSTRPGLRRLCEATGVVNPEPDAIIRKLVPKLNAAGRLGDCLAVRHLLCREAPEPHEVSMGAVEAAHEQTKALHRRIMGEAMAQATRINFRDEKVVVVASAGWHRGLMGPLASQLAQMYARPAIAISLEDGVGVGSARSIPSVDVLALLRRCGDLLTRFGGHAQACGLSLFANRLIEFRQQLNVSMQDTAPTLGRMVDYDLDLPLAALEEGWVAELERFAPFGMGNPKPTVVVRSVRFETKSPRRGWISNGAQRISIQGTIPTGPLSGCVDVAASPSMDRGELTLRLRDVRIAEEL